MSVYLDKINQVLKEDNWEKEVGPNGVSTWTNNEYPNQVVNVWPRFEGNTDRFFVQVLKDQVPVDDFYLRDSNIELPLPKDIDTKVGSLLLVALCQATQEDMTAIIVDF